MYLSLQVDANGSHDPEVHFKSGDAMTAGSFVMSFGAVCEVFITRYTVWSHASCNDYTVIAACMFWQKEFFTGSKESVGVV